MLIRSTPEGRAVLGWWTVGRRRHLLVGLNVVEELVRYTQGDPDKVRTYADKSLWKTGGHERSTYLYDDNIVPGYELTPWADRLGFMLVQLIAAGSGLPLFSPLPKGARGGVLLTGDDDTALLKKYDEQLKLIDGFPITSCCYRVRIYNAETLARLPANVELGVHIDALEQPDRYDAVCRAQTKAVRALAGRSATTVRNHGHLNSGYWGHLAAWEECGLAFDSTVASTAHVPRAPICLFKFADRTGRGRTTSACSRPSVTACSTCRDGRKMNRSDASLNWPIKSTARCRAFSFSIAIPRTFPMGTLFTEPLWTSGDGAADCARSRELCRLAPDAIQRAVICQSGRLKLQSSSTVENLALSWPSLGITRTDVLPRWQGEIELSTRFE